MAVATYQQVATALGRPTTDFTPDQLAQMTWWLSGIELLIKNRLGEVGALDQDAVTYVEVEAVAEKVRYLTRNEESITVTADDGSVTRRYRNVPVTDSDITSDWWALLLPGPEQGAFTIRPYAPRCRALDAEWCP